MRGYVRTRPVLSFGMMSMLFSLLFLPLHLVFPDIGNFGVSFPQLGPLAAVILLAFLLQDRSILFRIREALCLGVTWRWAVAVIALPGALIVSSGWVMSLLGFPPVPWPGNPAFLALNLLGILVGAAAEEAGWRGYLLPALQARHTPTRSAVLSGILWGVWHLNFTGGIPGFLLYTLTIIQTAILMTWIYNRTGGALSLMVTYHLFFNVFSRMFLWQRFTVELFMVQSVVFGSACLLVRYLDQQDVLRTSFRTPEQDR